MNKQEVTRLPKRIVRQERKKELERGVKSSLQALQEAFDSLKNLEDLDNVPSDPKEITREWIDGVLKEKTGNLEQLPMPKAMKKEIMDRWKTIYNEATGLVTIIQHFFNNYDGIEYHVTEDGEIVLTNLSEWILAASGEDVPELAQPHYELWCGVREAIGKLRTWEREHDLKKFPLELILMRDVDAQKFAEIWVNDSFTLDYFDKKPMAEENRRIADKFYL